MRTFLILLALFLGILSYITRPVHAKGPDEFLIDLMEEAQILTHSELQDREDMLLDLIQTNFDTQKMGKFVLGRHWKKATDEQRDKFIRLFTLISIKQFAPLVSGIPLDTFKIIKIDYRKNDNVSVISTIEVKKRLIKIHWRLRRQHPGGIRLQDWPEYKIIDVIAEGISLALTLRSEYGTVVKTEGVHGLIYKLQKKLEELENES